MNTKTKGIITETQAIAEFCKRGYVVSLPIGENSPYDLIVDISGRLYKVQCKTARINGNAITFNLASVYYTKESGKFTRKLLDKSLVDVFAVYCIELDTFYVVPVDSIKGFGTCNLRIGPTLKRDLHRTLQAEDFIIDKTLEVMRIGERPHC